MHKDDLFDMLHPWRFPNGPRKRSSVEVSIRTVISLLLFAVDERFQFIGFEA